MKKIIIEKTNKKYIVSKYLLEKFPNLRAGTIFKALRNKDIRVNEKRIHEDIQLKENDILEIYISDNLLFKIPNDIKIPYEDDNILIAYKPQGILSNIGDDENEVKSSSNDEPTFLDLIKKIRPNDNIKICHRLDRNTEGLVIFSKNDVSHKEILNGFKDKLIEKEYIAYVFNQNFEKKHEILKGFLLKDSKTSYVKIYTTNVKGSSEIITEYTVLDKDAKLNIAKLNVKIHTGKTHQIRAHLSFIGHPIVGDGKYGINELNKKIRLQKQLLYAYKYCFDFTDESPLNYLNEKKISVKIENFFKEI